MGEVGVKQMFSRGGTIMTGGSADVFPVEIEASLAALFSDPEPKTELVEEPANIVSRACGCGLALGLGSETSCI
jgi:hypothetical protein